jgi:hypothetical protein
MKFQKNIYYVSVRPLGAKIFEYQNLGQDGLFTCIGQDDFGQKQWVETRMCFASKQDAEKYIKTTSFKR